MKKLMMLLVLAVCFIACGSGKSIEGEWYTINPKTGKPDLSAKIIFNSGKYTFFDKYGNKSGSYTFEKADGLRGKTGRYDLVVKKGQKEEKFDMFFSEDKHKIMWIDMGKKLILARVK